MVCGLLAGRTGDRVRMKGRILNGGGDLDRQDASIDMLYIGRIETLSQCGERIRR